MSKADHIQAKLHSILHTKGLIPPNSLWELQTGGRTNLVWRLRGEQDYICKLYLDASDNPLYANTPRAEFECLQTLDGHDVAPKGHAFLETEFGDVLLYHFVDGTMWQSDGRSVARLLMKIQKIDATRTMRRLSPEPADVIAQGMKILESVGGRQADEIAARAPKIRKFNAVPDVLLHTDVVPGNLVQSADGLYLIDWQCPAVGDPLVDMAMFLSPAMHLLYGAEALNKQVKADFLYAFPDAFQERYEKFGMLYHWRMMAYCLWKIDAGHGEYSAALLAEMALLET